MNTSTGNARRSLVFALITLAILAFAAVAMWYLARTLSSPLSGDNVIQDSGGFRHILSIYGSGADRLNRPTEVAVDSQGRIYVADTDKHRIMAFDQNGTFVNTFGGPAIVQGGLKYPASVAVDSRGRIYTTSKDPDKIVVFSPQGEPIGEFPVPQPLTMAIAGDRLYVVTAQGILLGSLDGEQVGQLSGRGKEPGLLDRATGLVIDTDGTLYIADSLNYRFQALDSTGEVKWTDGTAPDPSEAVVDRSRAYGLPVDITLGSDGLLYALDAFNGEVHVFDRDGVALASYAAWGRQDGEFYYPSSIAEVSPERFVIADTFNDRLQIMHIPSPRPSAPMVARRALPWLAFPALLLVFLAFWRRRPSIVTDQYGLRRANDLALLPELMGRARVLYVPEGTAEAVQDLFSGEPDLAKVLREIDAGAVPDGLEPSIHIASRLRGAMGLRRVALALPTPRVADEARSLGIGVLEPEGEAVAEVATA